MATVDLQEIERLHREKLITVRAHPDARVDLLIANYAPQVQFNKLWGQSPLLPLCRGLIFTSDGIIKARPFEKFFNYGEYTGPLPDSPYEVTEKMDGSLGILYWIGDRPYIATRGSFTSEQAIEGTQILRDRYSFVERDGRNPNHTFLFEILFPENRIVVDYGRRRDLILLAVVDTDTGKDVPMTQEFRDNCRFPTPQRYTAGYSLDELKVSEIDNFEGFVVHWPETGLRLKVKLDEYLRLHKVLTGVSARTIWQALKNGDSLEEWKQNVPDEFADFIRTTEQELRDEFDRKAAAVTRIYDSIMSQFVGVAWPDRSAFAREATKFACRDILFLMFDGKPWADRIWKRMEPVADAPSYKREA